MSHAVYPVARSFLLTLEFYPLGSCNAGDACKFSHNLETAQDRQPCKYFQKGNCKFGAKCALLHIIDGRPVNDPVAQQINTSLPPTGFQRQMPMVGNPQVSGLSSGLLGMQQLGNNHPPPNFQNGYHTQPQQQSYLPPRSPTMNDSHFHSAISSRHNSPPSPPKYQSGLSSAFRNHENEPDLPRSSSMNLLGPLDAPFPSSVDLTNNHIARHGPFAASVPSKFGIHHSGISSLAGSVRDRVVTGDYLGSGTQSPVHGDYGSRYGSPMDSHPWSQDFSRSGGSLFLQSIQQQRTNPTSPMHSRPQSSSSPFVPFDQKPAPPPSSRLNQLNRTRLTPISSSVPAAHFGEKGPFSPIPAEEDEALDPDALPSSLHDEVLLPQELNRRSSQSHTPGLNRRSSAYDEFARSPPSGAVTPGSERGGGGGSLAGSPGSSRMESLWGIKIPDDPLAEMTNLSLSNNTTPSRQRVASPLRHPLEPTYSGSSAARPALKTPSVYAAQKWGGRTAEKLFPHVNGETPHPVNVPGVAWRLRTGDISVGRGELSSDDVRRIKEEEEGTQFSME